ncbi:hypothetical protein HUO13_05985 [Saccharopolyspora erythraea]|uniref:hypothetical protein n=1 Tax=Saccharopolyspora erythraea TaxID=1836 RepID=UPI001BA4FEBB|nr:hypothetical protein [Saccharopolyspora erythraea]QUH00426.1 hypothetical protein HUO13_05985 [Saccharopolyspora erythraea]
MSIRLYTICAMCVTASAVAGVLVGGFLAASSREASTPLPPVSVSHSVPVESAGVAVPMESAGGMGVVEP